MTRTITTEFFLLLKPSIERFCNEDSVRRISVEAKKSKPKLGPHDQAIQFKLEVPESLFFKPALTARISVPEGDAPPVITPEIQHQIAEIIHDQTGITLNITAPGADDE